MPAYTSREPVNRKTNAENRRQSPNQEFAESCEEDAQAMERPSIRRVPSQ